MRCGDSCTTPDDFDKIKKLEPHVEVVKVSNPYFECYIIII